MKHTTWSLFILTGWLISLPVMAATINQDHRGLGKLYQHALLRWHIPENGETVATTALKWLENADQHGLDPDNYYFQQLQQLKQGRSSKDKIAFDQLLSQAMLKFSQHLATGQFNMQQADPQWHINGTEFDAAAFVDTALRLGDLDQALTRLIPGSRQYRTLQQALVNYQDYADADNWPEIEASPLLRPGDSHPVIATLRERLAAEFALESNDENTNSGAENYDTDLAAAVEEFQERYNLEADGIIGSQTRSALNVSAADRVKQIRLNLERMRWLPRQLGERYIIVNTAGYHLKTVDERKTQQNMRVIVGQPYRQTPSFESDMTHIVFNPYWNVPSKLARRDVLPRQQQDDTYLRAYGFEVFTNVDGERVGEDIDAIDWNELSSSDFPYSLRQKPGPLNALGQMKFMFLNPWQIFLHDTPQRELFTVSRRNFSSGCIRVEDPRALAEFVLDDVADANDINSLIDTGQNLARQVKRPVKVYAVYFTAWSEAGEIRFTEDHYQRDARMLNLL